MDIPTKYFVVCFMVLYILSKMMRSGFYPLNPTHLFGTALFGVIGLILGYIWNF